VTESCARQTKILQKEKQNRYQYLLVAHFEVFWLEQNQFKMLSIITHLGMLLFYGNLIFRRSEGTDQGRSNAVLIYFA